MPGLLVNKPEPSVAVHVIEAGSLDNFLDAATDQQRAWVASVGFEAKLGQVVLVPDRAQGVACVLAGWGDEATRDRGRLHMATIAEKLPDGVYHLDADIDGFNFDEATLAWALSGYTFDRYKKKSGCKARLIVPLGVLERKVSAMVQAEFLVRDLINTPASDMGPKALEEAVKQLGKTHKAKVKTIEGDALLKQNLPMIHAVGRASDQAPRLVELRWGQKDHPLVTLVGKGVCFDTGGLNIKPASSMGLMKKDMGGAANVLGLAHMIMALEVPVRLRVLIPAVENSISAGAYRPQDVLTSRKGLTVEINNTDAEGRLVLADALALADEEKPDFLICMATLTGAARVALGPDLMPFYTDDATLAGALKIAGETMADPLWQMPFWQPYEALIEPDIADLDNAPGGGMAGSVTAALFLRRFVTQSPVFVHMDIFGWTPVAKPGRSKGGACQGPRALLSVIQKRFAQ